MHHALDEHEAIGVFQAINTYEHHERHHPRRQSTRTQLLRTVADKS